MKSGWLFGERFNADATPKVVLRSVDDAGQRPPSAWALRAEPRHLRRFRAKNIQVALDLVYHFQPRTAKNRLFVMAGPAMMWYQPGSSTRTECDRQLCPAGVPDEEKKTSRL